MAFATLLPHRLRAALGFPSAHLALAEHLGRRGDAVAAVRHIAAAARAGLASAQTRLGLCYLRGQGVPVSIEEARHWLHRAAAVDDPGALTGLSWLALRGLSGPIERGPFAARDDQPSDHATAAALARKAAAKGSAEARALLAFILEAAPDLAEGPDESARLYEASAAGGWPLGHLGHARNLLRAGRTAEAATHLRAATGLPTAHYLLGSLAEAEGDPARAVTEYRTAAEAGHRDSRTRLGLALMRGQGVRRNLTEAETWLRRAALDGDATAAAHLGDHHAGTSNLTEAARWHRQAAVLGHAPAARALARLIQLGAEGQPDPLEALTWLQAAIEGGEAAAWPDLGALILSSPLPPRTAADLHGWLRRMMRAKHPGAGLYAGICHNNGIGTERNEAQALRHYLMAAAMGAVEAMPAAAEMLLNGRGVPADPALARAMFRYAARRHHAGASFALGLLSRHEPDKAAAHFRAAAALGHPGAQAMLAA